MSDNVRILTVMSQPHTTALDTLKVRITQHYDLASTYYHSLWGQHIHHGLFTNGCTTKEAAQSNLIEHLLKLSSFPASGAIVLDVGCGLGGTTRYLAQHRAAKVTGITISSQQVELARKITAQEDQRPNSGEAQPSITSSATTNGEDSTPYTPFHDGSLRYLHLDADHISTTFPPSTYTHIWITECLSHIANKPLFFSAAYKTLTPSGRLVIADWFSPPSPTLEQSQTIKQIEDGMLLPSLPTVAEYVNLAKEAGFTLLTDPPEDLSKDVAKTWDISWGLVASPSLWAYAVSLGRDGLTFLQSFRAMRKGYAEGSMLYAVMVFEKRS